MRVDILFHRVYISMAHLILQRLLVYTSDYMPNSEIEALFQAGAHIGYGKARKHPTMREYIFGTRNNVEIFDLEQTLAKIREAEEFLCSLGREGKIVLWVGTKPASSPHIKKIAARLNLPYVEKRWLGGTITNFKVIGGRLTYWQKTEEDKKTGKFEKYVKKERIKKEAELVKLGLAFAGLRTLKKNPDALVIIDPKEEKTALREAFATKIPVIAILNSDSDRKGIRYPIPANDNSYETIAVILERLAMAYETGAKEQTRDKIRNNEVGVQTEAFGKD